jgi:hypothetical protein
VQWLVENWQIDRRLILPDYVSPIQFLIIHMCSEVNDDCLTRSLAKLARQATTVALASLRHIVYDLCVDWTGTDELYPYLQERKWVNAKVLNSVHLRKKLKVSPRRPVCYAGMTVDLIQDYMTQFRAGFFNPFVAGRIVTLEYLISILSRPVSAFPVTLHALVVSRQLQLLKWYIDNYAIDIHASLDSAPATLDFAHTRPFMVDRETGEFFKGLTVCEFLCAVAVSEDCLLEAMWLFPLCDNRLFTVCEGLNMFSLAASCGSYLVLKWLWMSRTFVRGDISSGCVSEYRVSVGSNSQHVADFLWSFVVDKNTVTSQSVLYAHYMMDTSVCITLRWNEAATLIQSVVRMHFVRRKYECYGGGGSEWLAFKSVWGSVRWTLTHRSKSVQSFSWATLKLQHDLVVSCLLENRSRENAHCSAVGSDLVSEVTELAVASGAIICKQLTSTVRAVSDVIRFDNENVDASVSVIEEQHRESTLENIELSSQVLKWMSCADPVLRGFFFDRVARLANGERSYALSKRLKHCAYPVFETKLDRGERILWTKLRRGVVESILVSEQFA